MILYEHSWLVTFTETAMPLPRSIVACGGERTVLVVASSVPDACAKLALVFADVSVTKVEHSGIPALAGDQ